MNKDKKVLFVVSTLNTGGAQRAFANLSLFLNEQGIKRDFLLNDAENISYPYCGNIIDLGLKGQKDKTALFYQFRVFVKRLKKLKALKKSGNYVSCISALTSANAINVLTGVKGVKTIISIRNHMTRKLSKGGFKAALERWGVKVFSKHADLCVCVSESIRMDMTEHFGVPKEKAVTIYNSYPVESIKDLAGYGTAEKYPVTTLINIGRLSGQKAQDKLIRVFKRVHDKLENTRLLILGDGPLKDSLKSLAEELGIEDYVEFTGFVDNPYTYLVKSHLFVMTSGFEGFPNTMAESLCLGVPVVSTDCDSGPREILAPGTDISHKVLDGYEEGEYGILCPVMESEAHEVIFAESIIRLLTDERLYSDYAKRAQERALDFSDEVSASKWMALF